MGNDDFSDERTIVGDPSAIVAQIATESVRENAYVIVIAGPNVGEMYRLPRGEATVGRGSDATIHLPDNEISRLHAKIINRGETVIVADNNSTNGTFVNGHQVRFHALQDGDKIQIGTTTILKFSYHDALEEKFQRQMLESALRDGLTGAFNKKYFSERLTGEVAFSLRHGTPVALMLFDIDHFKPVNDTHGHLAGDSVLATFAERVSSMIRREDVFARYGGEEFAVLSRGLDIPSARSFAERIRQLIADYEFVFDDAAIPITVSVGVAGMPELTVEQPTDLVAAADQALYAAKRNGRNRTEVYAGK
ncbi:MAG: GGDEF domain-containing protein [Polyangiales bacterium]|nr:GGDEF domain-containing protein [Myxococcales bacterium]MCB9657783.1 GGDEF domain-containing protein [Sandaracinaceae bacterium]